MTPLYEEIALAQACLAQEPTDVDEVILHVSAALALTKQNDKSA